MKNKFTYKLHVNKCVKIRIIQISIDEFVQIYDPQKHQKNF
jgi:hypothetical protein